MIVLQPEFDVRKRGQLNRKSRIISIFKFLNFKYLTNNSAMISTDKVTSIFCSIDDFCNVFEPAFRERQLSDGRIKRNRKYKMSLSEVLTITVLFHLSGCRNFKHYYTGYVQKHLNKEFPSTVSYNRFVELMQSNLFPLTVYMKTCCLGECTGISFIDSTPIRVCGKKRIARNKVFAGIAATGKSTMGWFHGFKLHIVINDKGELLDFMVTQGNVDDRAPLKQENFLKTIFGSLYADKGYISKELVEILFNQGTHLVTGIRNNMKNVFVIVCVVCACWLLRCHCGACV